jgi:hypothetical protein
MWEEAPMSRNHSVELRGGAAPVLEVWSAAIRADVSQGEEDDVPGSCG